MDKVIEEINPRDIVQAAIVGALSSAAIFLAAAYTLSALLR